ncbi:hypothetical protein [Gloeocapsopsis dulcis]|uniref:hypothetical protein n=1 Tax=Gloeocapsopsis dulcis TaxID=2859516 RepID=UPI0012DAF468|nr:hypothetical protein [Gloeocapsopsis dulcis]WNN91658.1 hypothetical protein P0S91_11555 [Gloeocapsopsis dulcis]
MSWIIFLAEYVVITAAAQNTHIRKYIDLTYITYTLSKLSHTCSYTRSQTGHLHTLKK